MLNQVVLIGRLTADPEIRYTQSGLAVTNFRLAVDRPFKNRDGKKETDFLNIVAWRQLAETVANHLGKGRLVAVTGNIQARQWQTPEGDNRWSVEIHADDVRFLDFPGDSKPKPQDDFFGDAFDDEDLEAPF